MIEKISTLSKYVDFHVVAILAVVILVVGLFLRYLLGSGKKTLEDFNTKELLPNLNRSKQDFDQEKEEKVVSLLIERQRTYNASISNGQFNPNSFLIHFIAYICIKNYTDRGDVAKTTNYRPKEDDDLKEMFVFIGQCIASYEAYEAMINVLKRVVGDIQKMAFVAHEINPRFTSLVPANESNGLLSDEIVEIAEHIIISAIQSRLKDEPDIADAYDILSEEDELYAQKILNEELRDRLKIQHQKNQTEEALFI